LCSKLYVKNIQTVFENTTIEPTKVLLLFSGLLFIHVCNLQQSFLPKMCKCIQSDF